MNTDYAGCLGIFNLKIQFFFKDFQGDVLKILGSIFIPISQSYIGIFSEFALN